MSTKDEVTKKDKWYNLSNEERIKEILRLRALGKSWQIISEELLGSEESISKIYTWARRNISKEDMKKAKMFSAEKLSDAEMWTMFDIISGLYPRLDAIVTHLLHEITNLQQEQERKFNLTANFLDQIEERMMKSLSSLKLQEVLQNSIQSKPMTNIDNTKILPSPQKPDIKSKIPPPPPVPKNIVEGTSFNINIHKSFEEMSLIEINTLSPNYLENLSLNERTKLQERVKELKYIQSLPEKEQGEYINKKKAEKELKAASMGVGDSLMAQLSDDNSLFAKMKRAAQESEISGSGTFGQFTADFFYSYCISCGKTLRTESKTSETCNVCGADQTKIVEASMKTNYEYYECPTCKMNEISPKNYSRGCINPITSRWKLEDNQKDIKCPSCNTSQVRKITNYVLMVQDPDQEFSHYLTLFRLYRQKGQFPEFIDTFLTETYQKIQLLPDLFELGQTKSLSYEIVESMEKLVLKLKDLISRLNKPIENHQGVLDKIDYLLKSITDLSQRDSPHYIGLFNETGKIKSKMDQLLNNFTSTLDLIYTRQLLLQ